MSLVDGLVCTLGFVVLIYIIAFYRTYVFDVVRVDQLCFYLLSFFLSLLFVCLFCFCFVSSFCVLCPMLPVSPECPFLFVPSVFSNVY